MIGLFLFLQTGCDKPQTPKFVRMENVKVGKINFKDITLLGNIVINNPNSVGITITHTDLDVSVDGKNAGKVLQTETAKMPANSEFSLPVKTIIPTKNLGDGLIGSALSAFVNKKIIVQYKGHVTVKVLNTDLKIPVNDEQEVMLKE